MGREITIDKNGVLQSLSFKTRDNEKLEYVLSEKKELSSQALDKYHVAIPSKSDSYKLQASK